MSPGAGPPAMAADINCTNWRVLIAYIEDLLGAQGVERMLDGLGGNPAYLLQD